jgi:hypothetical protein
MMDQNTSREGVLSLPTLIPDVEKDLIYIVMSLLFHSRFSSSELYYLYII